MNHNRTGGPAFPSGEFVNMEPWDGMTLRDYFAAKALQGWLADGLDTDPENAAEQAYAIADAMIAAREK
jgi:hypothetical protein